MTQSSSVAGSGERDAILARFSSNLPRHIVEVAGALNQRLLSSCHDAGYDGVKAPFLPVLFQLTPDGGRIIDIARHAGITQQAAGQIADELERLGYLRRKPDPSDRRAKMLRLTVRGERLIATVIETSKRIEQELGQGVGDTELAGFKDSASQLFTALAANGNPGGGTEALARALPLCLSGLATYGERRLMELDKTRGYTGLKLSFSQVLMYTSPHGTTINDLARINDVSKQAISQIVSQVEELGYVERRRNPGDARSTMVFLSDAGLRLIRDSIDNIAVLEADFSRILGRPRQQRFARTIERLFNALPVTALQLSTTPEDQGVENILRRTLERLYLECDEGTRARLFSGAGSKARLSAAALKMIDALEIRTQR